MRTLKYGKFSLVSAVIILPLLLSKTPAASQDIVPEKKKSDYFLKINASAGYTKLFFKPPGRLSPEIIHWHIDELNKCYHFSADINYMNKTGGFGIKFSHLTTSNSLENVLFTDYYGNTASGFLQDEITINYVGPTIMKQVWIGKQKSFVMNNQLSIGYIQYRNHPIMIRDYHVTGNALGVVWDLGFDYLIIRNIAVGVTASAMYGKMKSFHVNEDVDHHFSLVSVDFENGLNVSRVDFEIGIKAYF